MSKSYLTELIYQDLSLILTNISVIRCSYQWYAKVVVDRAPAYKEKKIIQGTETGLSIWLRSSTAFRKLLEFQVISISFEPVFLSEISWIVVIVDPDSTFFGGSFCCFVGLFCYTDLWKLHLPERHKKRGVTVVRSFNRSSYLWAEKEVKELESILRSKNQITIPAWMCHKFEAWHIPKSTQLHPPDHHISFFPFDIHTLLPPVFPVFPPRYSPK